MSAMDLFLNVLIVPSLRAVAEMMNVSFIRNLGRTLFFKIPTTECFTRVPFSINEPALCLKDVLAGGAASVSFSAACLQVTCSLLIFGSIRAHHLASKSINHQHERVIHE